MLRKLSLTLTLLALTAGAASAQVKLERKLAEEKTGRTEVTSHTTQKLTIAGMEIDTESNSRTTVKTSTGKRDDSGYLKTESRVEDLQITVKIQGTEYMFDSANPDTAGGSPLEILRPVHKGTLQRTTITTFDKDNKVSRIEFDTDPVANLADNVRNLLKGQFDPETLKATANQELERLPTDPVKVGDAWERTSVMNLEGGQKMKLNTRYTYVGETEKNGHKYDKIESKILSVDFSIVGDGLGGLQLKSSNLKPGETRGELLFDRESGEVVYATNQTQIVGEIVFSANNMELPAKLDLKLETTVQPKQ